MATGERYHLQMVTLDPEGLEEKEHKEDDHDRSYSEEDDTFPIARLRKTARPPLTRGARSRLEDGP